MGNEHTQSIRAEQSGGRGKIGTKAGFWKEQELEWGVNRNRMGEGSPGTPARGRNPSLSQRDSKQTEDTVTQALCSGQKVELGAEGPGALQTLASSPH